MRVDDDMRVEAAGAIARGRTRRRTGADHAATATDAERGRARGAGGPVARAEARRTTRASATRAFERERFTEARKLLKPLAERAPGSAPRARAVRPDAVPAGPLAARSDASCEAFRTLTGSTEQLPVLADCYRALRRYDEVEELWKELRSRVAERRARRPRAASSPPARWRIGASSIARSACSRQGRSRRSECGRTTSDSCTRSPTSSSAPATSHARGQLFRQVADADPDFADVSQSPAHPAADQRFTVTPPA